MMTQFAINAKYLRDYDVVVCGGGFAGVAAAVRAAENGARTLLIESGGELGGDLTKGRVGQFLDAPGKGGMMADINRFLNEGGHTAPRRGPHYDENGRKLPGTLFELEYAKYYLDKVCLKAGVDVAFYSLAAAVETEQGRITRLLMVTEAGSYIVEAPMFIDATGNGQIAGEAGCEYEFGHPVTGQPQPANMAVTVIGLDESVKQTDSEAEKIEMKRKLEAYGVKVSANEIHVGRSSIDGLGGIGGNFQYNVPHDDIFGLSRATMDGRGECVDIINALNSVPGFERVRVVQTSSHIGIREGKRIKGMYFVTYDDIVSGASFEDAICQVRFGIDVHAISSDDKRDHTKGQTVKPYHIPYRSLVPLGCSNLLLAGRCISGDFYAHASYRVAADVIAMGEAAGYAAALCVKEGISPAELDGRRVKDYMVSQGYEI